MSEFWDRPQVEAGVAKVKKFVTNGGVTGLSAILSGLFLYASINEARYNPNALVRGIHFITTLPELYALAYFLGNTSERVSHYLRYKAVRPLKNAVEKAVHKLDLVGEVVKDSLGILVDDELM